jgi:hypothetical protein
MRLRTALVTLAAALLLAPGRAGAAPRDVAVSVTRLGGDSAAAQPYLDSFLRSLEQAAGWPAGSSTGAFLATRSEALAFVARAKPGIGILDPPLYFELRASARLAPLVQIESAELVSPRLHVVVKDPAFAGLADLRGKRLWSTLADYPRYLSRVVLEGRVDAAAHFELKQVGQALKGVRGVLRGDCEATTLDDEQLARAREITGGGQLRVIHSSPPLPPLAVAAFGEALGAADRRALVAALLALCGSAQGAPVCAQMHIGRFVPVDAARFSEAQQRFER